MAFRARVQQPRDRRRLSSHRQSASRPRGTCDCHPGGGERARRRELPDRRGPSSHRQSARWPRGTCDSLPGGARDPDRRRLSFQRQHVAAVHHRGPVGRLPTGTPARARSRAAATLLAGQSDTPPCDLRARARGRAGTGSGRSPIQPAGRPQSALVTIVSVRPASGRQQTGRCGVLTRIRVGAAASAGPGRRHVTRTQRARTTRHGDEAAASSSCRLPVPLNLKVLQGCTRCTK